MTELVHIKPAPPLSQSLVKVLSCPRSYRAIVVDGLKPPPSGPSDRGTEVHYVAAAYTDHCVAKGIAGDWVAFDRIASSVGAEAFAILEGVRDNYTVDFEHVVGTEIWFCLDDNFKPVPMPELDESSDWTREEKESWASANGVAYQGTIDIGLLKDNQGGIDDWKSNLRPFDAPDAQSDQYALAWFQLNPQIDSLRFRFRFVRYAHCERTADYTRKDLPRLMAAFEHHRAKQIFIHEHPEKAEAIPSKQCLYCPLLKQGCPIDQTVNPYATPDMNERVKRAVYLSYANAENNTALKEWVDATGESIEYQDSNGNRYVFGPRATESLEFPLLRVMEKLIDWKGAAPDDVAWFDKLRVSSSKLKPYLKAKKRATLDQSIRDVAILVSKIRTGLHKPVDDKDEPEEYGGGE